MKLNFNLQNVKPYGSNASKLPDGEYVVKAVGEETTERGALVLSYVVLSGDYRGAIVKDWINLNHEKEAARDIAQRRLKSIVQAVGLETVNDTRELFGRPFLVSVSTRRWTRNDGTTTESNSIDAYRTYREEQDPAQLIQSTPTTNPPTIAAAGPFWGN